MTRTGGRPVILSLCDGLGSWSDPYEEAGYHVIRIDVINDGPDVRLLKLPRTIRKELLPVRGILAAPPCTCFSNAGQTWPRSDAEMLEALSVVDACLRFVIALRPAWWVLENPRGRLGHWLGPPAFKFHPWQFGDGYWKETWLWGEFTPPVPTVTVAPPRRKGGAHDYDTALRTSCKHPSATRAQLRAQTPPGFANAFCWNNP